MDDLNPFWSANKLAVTKALKDKGYFDIYINNFIWVVVYIGGNKAYLKAAPGTVIHSIFHCTYNPKHVKRDNMIAKDKFQAEGAISEEHIYLWLILNARKNTHTITNAQVYCLDRISRFLLRPQLKLSQRHTFPDLEY